MDLRLLPAAVASWTGSAAMLWAGPAIADPGQRRSVVLAASAVAVVLSGGLVAALLLGRWRTGQRALAVAVAVLMGSAATVSAGLHVLRLSEPSVVAAAQSRAVGWVELRIDGDPQTRQGGVSGSWRRTSEVDVGARLLSLSARGSTTDLEVPVRLSLDAGDPVPEPGTIVAGSVRLYPASGLDTAAVVRPVTGLETVSGPGAAPALATTIRAGLRQVLAHADPAPAALVAGLAVGDESTQPPGLADDMRVAGLSHLTAVSGGNVAIVLVVVLGAARLAGLRRRGRALVAVAALVGFVVLVRPQPSVLRAAAMGLVVVVALVAGGRRTAVPALLAAVCVLVVVSPVLATSLGFALSVSATAGLLWIAPRIRDRCSRARWARRWPPALLAAVSVSLAAQLATAPLIAAIGGGVGLLTVPANVLVTPAVVPVTVLGLAAALLSVAWPAAAALVASAAVPFASWIALVAARIASLPAATLPWPQGPTGALLLVAAMAAAVIAARAWRRGGASRDRARVAAAVIAVGLVVAGLRPLDRWPPPGWILVACDVGQGDGLVLRTGDSGAVVIDTGPDPEPISRCLTDLGISTVPAVVLTHFHADHAGGIAGVLDGRDVGVILVGPLREPADEAARVDEVALRAGVPVRTVAMGEAGRAGAASWTVMWPRRVIAESAPNNTSIVLLAEVAVGERTVRLLLGADVEPAAQAAMRAGLPPLQADVVKVPHHGSSHQDPVLPSWSGGRIALVSVGAGNPYGHPAPETLDAWNRSGAVIGRTDAQGDLAVVATPDGPVGLVARR